MDGYRVYNPFNEADVRVSSYVRALPDETQRLVRRRLEEALAERGGDTAATEHDVDEGMSGRLSDLEGIIDVAEVLDEWAVAESFDPERVVTEEAAWLLVRDDGAQAVLLAASMEDMSSPCGQSWDTHSFTWGEAYDGTPMWVEEHEGAYWGYQNAYELADEIAWPEGFDAGNTEMVRVPVEYVEKRLNVWADLSEGAGAPRLAVTKPVPSIEDEVRAMGYIDWQERDKPLFPSLFSQMAGPDGRVAEPIMARAGQYTFEITHDEGTRSVTGTVHRPDGMDVSFAVLDVGTGPGQVATAQREACESMYGAVADRFRGIENPDDPAKPYKSYAEAALSHYGRQGSAPGEDAQARPKRWPMPTTPKHEPEGLGKKTVTADARAAQESARAQTKSAPGKDMSERRGIR